MRCYLERHPQVPKATEVQRVGSVRFERRPMTDEDKRRLEAEVIRIAGLDTSLVKFEDRS